MNLRIGDFSEPDSETLPSDTSEIDPNSKTKSRTKKNSWTQKYVSEHCASFGMIKNRFFLQPKMVKKTKNRRNWKIDFWFVSEHCAYFGRKNENGSFWRERRGSAYTDLGCAAHSVETTEKSNFQFCDIYFFSYGRFCS